MKRTLHSHKVTINGKRRANKQISDCKNKGFQNKEMKEVFDSYYKNQVRALYRAICDSE